WLVLVLIVPTLANVGINAAIPVAQGAEIALAQREAVNHAWDIPREDTMRRFYARHPEWADSAPLGPAFHYKWYLAFHQNGDESVADRVRAYRQGLETRDAAGRALGWLLPPVGMQALLTRLADTDLTAQLAYQDRIRAFHRRLRTFYYAYLFHDRPFARSDFDRAPRFGRRRAARRARRTRGGDGGIAAQPFDRRHAACASAPALPAARSRSRTAPCRDPRRGDPVIGPGAARRVSRCRSRHGSARSR
ncbi:MAG: DUF3526 domain-containing protein, partial [Sphingomonas sp.]